MLITGQEAGGIFAYLSDGHVLVLVAEDVVEQNVVVTSLFFEKLAISVHVLLIRVHAHEATFSFIFQN